MTSYGNINFSIIIRGHLKNYSKKRYSNGLKTRNV